MKKQLCTVQAQHHLYNPIVKNNVQDVDSNNEIPVFQVLSLAQCGERASINTVSILE